MYTAGRMAALFRYFVGEGPDLTVLLHGFLGSGRNLRALALKWSARDPARKFIIPDLLGHGESPPLSSAATLDDVAESVLATIADAGSDRPAAIVGHSLGARVALAAVRREPRKVREVIMLDMAPGPADPADSDTRLVLDALLRAPEEVEDRRVMRSILLDYGLGPEMADWLLMNLSQRDGRYRWRIDRRALAELHDRFVREDLWPIVESRQVPIRCIRGELSRYVTDRDAARMQAAGCSVVTLPKAGHYVHVDAPGALLDALIAG